MMRKGQVKRIEGRDVVAQAKAWSRVSLETHSIRQDWVRTFLRPI